MWSNSDSRQFPIASYSSVGKYVLVTLMKKVGSFNTNLYSLMIESSFRSDFVSLWNDQISSVQKHCCCIKEEWFSNSCFICNKWFWNLRLYGIIYDYMMKSKFFDLAVKKFLLP